MRSISILALGASLASAIQFTDPVQNATLTRGATYDLTWDFVDTDPTSFSVYLVNFVNWPPYYTPLDLDIDTTTGEASVRVPCEVEASYGFQFNAINGTNVYVIYAQTPKFFITGDSCTDPTPSAPSSPTCAAPTVTVTVRGNSTTTTSPPLVTATGGGGSSGAANAPATTTTTTFAGTCPYTIGWSGNYSHPVTLTSTPHAGRDLATATATNTIPKGTALPTYVAGGHFNWNATTVTTLTRPASAPTAGATGLTAPVQKAGKGSCSKKRTVRKRHSDGGRPAPFPRKR